MKIGLHLLITTVLIEYNGIVLSNDQLTYNKTILYEQILHKYLI